MAVHIDEVGRVDALLISGTWLGVDPGTLRRDVPGSRSSGTGAVVYFWRFADADFMAGAEDVSAVRFTGTG